MTADAPTVVWNGSEALRPFLRPVGDLRVHPENPRVGDLPEITRSLERFGQVRVVLLDTDGSTIVAGNHRYLAMVELGWTHVAAVPNEFASADEARAYLLADNRLAEKGDYDAALLRQELTELEKRGEWDGTGYAQKDLDAIRALERRAEEPLAPLPPPPPAPPPAGDLSERLLMFTPAQREEFTIGLRVLYTEYGTDGTSETVLAALVEERDRLAAEGPDG